MGARIQVLVNGRPKEGEEVHISWRVGGHSRGRTDSSGTFNSGSTGTADTVYINGKEVMRGTVLEDRLYQIPKP